ncbi:dual specificity mitogen-activated protein kinase kinase 5 isoform X3 [Cavia porcellus]|uniref:dual specificity mitogen-activated protein kinase kinase 5 isoform X3 n=1 Tax=Cavia porcellus TaxID=10141 RepID=UPI000661E9B1|nr:dual specificity mitogen-activated protein kinase kinase 5 isoform X1 [Cavia porcellus]XP_023417533.1 dual specificity mitogen-activated protein kinase kinase 5 isoform X1 [Cavia porcellus]
MPWLALGPYLAMDNQVLVIRIKIPNSGAVDWTVHSGPQLLFRDVLDVIGQVLPEATTTAFEYEDEDGDRITVRSDEEMKAMLSYYYSTVMEQQVNGQLIEPLQIFPRACKPPGERNIHGLKVNTRAGPSQHSSPAVLDSLPSNSLKKSSAELKKILANGQMNEQDIRYQDTLGHGNGGTVYKAYHVPSGKILAVKVILLDITLELQKQIMSELEILYKCDSSYIIGFYGAFFVENRISICTEFMDGGSLDVYKKIPEHVLGRIAVAVVNGLTYLWSLKILHRENEISKSKHKPDMVVHAYNPSTREAEAGESLQVQDQPGLQNVKPSNMLVNTRGQVKLCDFGVSTQLVNSIAKTYVGTNAYMAPERISGEQYGIHSDVWSLGISFMELALGRFPYPQIQKNQGSLMPLQLLQCIVDEDSPVLPVGEFSEPFVHFITQCMRKQPKERPAPEELMGHPFIMQFNDGNATVVSMWVCRALEERRSQQGPP